MISEKQFIARVKALYKSQQNMARARKWKSGKRAGTVRVPGLPVEFTESELYHALWAKVGLNAIPCPYCNVPIDILSLTLDHVIPRSLGGRFTLDNMVPCCVDDNHRKGEMSYEAFKGMLAFARRTFSSHDYSTLLKRLKAAHHGSQNRFHRDAQGNNANMPMLPTAKQMQLEEDF